MATNSWRVSAAIPCMRASDYRRLGLHQPGGAEAHAAGGPFDYADLAEAFTVVMRRRRELLTRQLSRLPAFAKKERRKARELQLRSRFARQRTSALPSVLPLAGRLRSGRLRHGRHPQPRRQLLCLLEAARRPSRGSAPKATSTSTSTCWSGEGPVEEAEDGGRADSRTDAGRRPGRLERRQAPGPQTAG
jgi:hypothetical protein